MILGGVGIWALLLKLIPVEIAFLCWIIYAATETTHKYKGGSE